MQINANNLDFLGIEADTPSVNDAPVMADAPVLSEFVPDARNGYSGVEEHASVFHFILEWTMAIVFPFLVSYLGYLSLKQLYADDLFWLSAIGALVGITLGDFVSGLVHWGADTYFHDDTPVLGAAFIRPFRLHHIYPRDICTHNLVSILGNTCILAVPVMFGMIYLQRTYPDSTWLAFTLLTLNVMTLVTVLTNLFHKWAHLEAERVPAIVKWLQSKSIVLNPAHHKLHHTHPFGSAYCITNGWVNPLLDRINFFRRVESGLRAVGVRTAIEVRPLKTYD